MLCFTNRLMLSKAVGKPSDAPHAGKPSTVGTCQLTQGLVCSAALAHTAKGSAWLQARTCALEAQFRGHNALNTAVSLSFLRPKGTNFGFDLLHRLCLAGDIIQLA